MNNELHRRVIIILCALTTSIYGQQQQNAPTNYPSQNMQQPQFAQQQQQQNYQPSYPVSYQPTITPFQQSQQPASFVTQQPQMSYEQQQPYPQSQGAIMTDQQQLALINNSSSSGTHVTFNNGNCVYEDDKYVIENGNRREMNVTERALMTQFDQQMREYASQIETVMSDWARRILQWNPLGDVNEVPPSLAQFPTIPTTPCFCRNC